MDCNERPAHREDRLTTLSRRQDSVQDFALDLKFVAILERTWIDAPRFDPNQTCRLRLWVINAARAWLLAAAEADRASNVDLPAYMTSAMWDLD